MGQIACCCAGESRHETEVGKPETPRRPQPEGFEGAGERTAESLDSPTAAEAGRDEAAEASGSGDEDADAKLDAGHACMSTPLTAFRSGKPGARVLVAAPGDPGLGNASGTPRGRAETAEAEAKERTATEMEEDGDAEAMLSSLHPARSTTRQMTFTEKIQQDFEEPALVAPDKRFDVPTATMQIFGELRFPEKFTEDKNVGVKTSAALVADGLEDSYAWSSPTEVEGATSIAVLCQKGQKSPDDPTPNQDNYFMKFVDGVSIYGVLDGHGPFGHLVSFRLVQSLPHILINHPSFGVDWEKAMKESFVAAQKELLTFAEDQGVNLEASGSAGSVLVMAGQQIHVAHIGDARIMLASYNRRDSKLIFATQDHKPELPAEKKRLEDAGTEVREVDKDSFRIYRRGTTFPGLTMSRAFGDTACEGVIQEPEYRQFSMQPTDEYYAIIASDGIWEFIEAEEAVTLTAKKLRLKGPRETLQSIVSQSRKRWAAVCGDYCDDITGIFVQWNAKSDASDTNHSLCLQRHDPQKPLQTKIS